MPFRFNPFTKKLDLIDLTAIPPGTTVSLTGNSGGAVPPDGGGNINTVGTGSITVAGNPGTNTLTAQLTGLTNHSLLVGAGTATITNLGVASNGQIPIGSAGADPVLANITSTDASVTITNGAGTIDLSVAGQVTGTTTTVGAVNGTTITFPLGAVPAAYQIIVNTVGFDTTVAAAESVQEIVTLRTDGVNGTIVGTPDFFVNDEGPLTPPLFFTTVAGNNVVVRVVGSPLQTVNWFSKLTYIKVS